MRSVFPFATAGTQVIDFVASLVEELDSFETSPDAYEVIVFKSKKMISVKRGQVANKMFPKRFRRMYEK